MDQTVKPNPSETLAPNPLSFPKVSVALSVFNGGEQLRYALQSVLNQTLTDWELIILDDGSTDGSIELIRQFNDPRIHLICDGQNRGLAARLNQAIDLARGQYFARMDHDDICHPERFARQVEFLQTHPDIDLLAAECVTMNEASALNGRLPTATEHQQICQRAWIGFYMPHPTWMGKLSWFRQHRYPEPAPYCSEDQELLLRTHTVSQFHTYPQALLAYRVRSYTPWKKLWRTRLTLCRTQIKYFSQHQQWHYAFLSMLSTLLRVSRDAWRALRHSLCKPVNTSDTLSTLDAEVVTQWQRHIQLSMKQSGSTSANQESSVD